MNRREMLEKALKLGAIAAISGPIRSAEKFTGNLLKYDERALTGNALRFPPLFNNGGTMTLAQSNIQVFPSQAQTQCIAINGSYPGPTVRIQRGDILTVHLQNNLTEPATIHWHGIAAPELMDGHPKDSIPAGGSYTYTFPVTQKAGTFFYHSHAGMASGKQVYKGFAGLFIVDDPAEGGFGLPSGNYDVPLVIQDRRQVDVPQFTYNMGTNEMMDGYLGDLPLVNGTPDPYFEVSKTKYRFRILNGSNARVYKLAIVDASQTPLQFSVISTDGGLKDIPANGVSSFFLSPGERVDIVMDFAPYSIGQSLTLRSLAFTAPAPMGSYAQGIQMDLLRFDVTSNQSSGGQVPAAFDPITYYNPANATTVRTFTLTMVSGGSNIHRINGLTFDMNRIDWQTPLLALEEWKVINATNEFHPMHSHGCQFQLYSRNGNTNLAPNDKGWKDTILLNPFETIRTLVKFTDFKGIYLYHCHNLEHEDDGMMLNFKVIDPIGIRPISTQIPASFALHQNYPNPFNPTTKIKFDVAKGFSTASQMVKLEIINSIGQNAAALVNEELQPGRYEVEWNAEGFASGTYFCRMETEGFVRTIRLALVK